MAKQFFKKIIPTYHDTVVVESLVWVKLLRYTVLVCIENLTREISIRWWIRTNISGKTAIVL